MLYVRMMLAALAGLLVLSVPAVAQVTANLPVTCPVTPGSTACVRAISVVNPDGTTIGGGGGGGAVTATGNVASNATQGPVCYPVTGATIKCYPTQTVTVSILGATVAPLTSAGAGVTGQVLAIPVS